MVYRYNNIVNDIKHEDFLKYQKNIFQVKRVEKIDNYDVVIHFYYRAIKQQNGQLYKNKSYRARINHLRFATTEEIEFLNSKIKKPGKINTRSLNEEECIRFLKEKGYLIYKQT